MDRIQGYTGKYLSEKTRIFAYFTQSDISLISPETYKSMNRNNILYWKYLIVKISLVKQFSSFCYFVKSFFYILTILGISILTPHVKMDTIVRFRLKIWDFGASWLFSGLHQNFYGSHRVIQERERRIWINNFYGTRLQSLD